jgi:hypothetical protein
MPGSLAIVIFYSDFSVHGKGFLMSYEAFTATEGPKVDFSPNIILSASPDANIKYPGNNSNYQNNDLSTFIYSPDHSYDTRSIVQADYILNGFETGCCCDFVTVYRFEPIFNANGAGWSILEQ